MTEIPVAAIDSPTPPGLLRDVCRPYVSHLLPLAAPGERDGYQADADQDFRRAHHRIYPVKK